MKIVLDDLSGNEIAFFLQEHIDEMKSISPPESKHALDLDSLRSTDITFWSAYEEDKLVGCGALKELDQFHGEIKSMRTNQSVRGKGVASNILKHIILTASSRGYSIVSLETGSMKFFEPARELYIKYGFKTCNPFGDYIDDPNSIFMSLSLKSIDQAVVQCEHLI